MRNLSHGTLFLVPLALAACVNRPSDDTASPVDTDLSGDTDSGASDTDPDDTDDSGEDTDETDPPVEVAQVSGGFAHTCALLSDGSVTCWGSDAGGALTAPAPPYDVISAGGEYTCGIRAGSLSCWGGEGRDVPVTEAPLGAWSTLSTSLSHSCAIAPDGTIACWGQNLNGEATPPGGAWAEVSAGSHATCARDHAGALACWGGGTMVDVVPPGTYTGLSCARGFGCALDAAGAPTCWGGIDSYRELEPPVGISFAEIDCGGFTCCGLDSDGEAHCWGRDEDGQATPPAGSFHTISAGDRHFCGITTAGDVTCWGDNAEGQSSPPALP